MSDPRIDRGDDGRNSKDVELVRRALARDADALRTIIQMHNQRLYRIARGLADDDSEAEDIVQEAYVNAFAHFAEFRGESALSTWLCRIVVNEALGRLRRSRRAAAFAKSAARANAEVIQFALDKHSGDAERTVAQRQILSLVEQATDRLPPAYRVVLIARAIEGLSNDETAELLGVRPETVRTRLHRARRLLRQELDEQIGPVLLNAFPFKGRRCERLIDTVIDRLRFPA
ncbi:RNA polymerase sigma factor [Mesorhizobium sp. M1005]|uniref:RNA polymerase sigma factor n=1 Tax=unclassified Mesorhizobium TaxID=325217 RepID=UPI003337141E